YGVSQKAISLWNNLSDNVIVVNQVLSVNGMNIYNTLAKETNRFDNTQQFINRVAPIALEMAKKYELYPSVMIAQAILETGSGKSELAEFANNYYGIKGTYKGNSIYKLSPEEVKGSIIQQSSRFRVYPSLRASVEDNAKRLRLGPNTDSELKPWNPNHYKATWVENAFTYRDATQALVDAGYATDSSYAIKLNNYIESYNLIQYDKNLYSFVDEREKYVAEAPARHFIEGVKVLPSVSAIEKSSASSLTKLQNEIKSLRTAYSRLVSSDQNKANVLTWLSYLEVKEKAIQDALTVKAPEPGPTKPPVQTPERPVEEDTNNSKAQAFIAAGRELPSVSQIEAMNTTELKALQTILANVRSLFNQLPATVKGQAEVKRWEGYLKAKEQAVAVERVTGEEFILLVRALPNVSTIEKMTNSQLATLINQMNTARNIFDQLSTSEQKKSEVVRWAGYLSDKEDLANKQNNQGDLNKLTQEFILAARSLPSVSVIQSMNSSQLNRVQSDMRKVRAQYNALPSAAKNNGEVIRWAGYLTDKETVVDNLMGQVDLEAAIAEFTLVSRELPSLSVIRSMNNSQLRVLLVDLSIARSLYDALPASAKTDADVKRWYGYLTSKEETTNGLLEISEDFITLSRALPSVSAINVMNEKQLITLEKDLEAVRKVYNSLPATAKQHADIVRWAGYLTDKETLVNHRLNPGEAFISEARKLPNLSAIEKMTNSQLQSVEKQAKEVRTFYNTLPTSVKGKSEVQTWEGYLKDKEQLVATQLEITKHQEAIDAFLNAADALPNISQIERMNLSQFRRLESEFKATRTIYNNLTAVQKRDAQVATWEGYVTAKENAVTNIHRSADLFIEASKALPSVSQINGMNDRQLETLAVLMQAARNRYNSLAPVAQQFSQVVTWEGYLTDKENAAFGVSSVRLNYDIKYGVESGDTINSIAQKFQVDVNRLIAKNPKVNTSNLRRGQVILVPNAIARPMNHPQARDGKHVVYLDAGHGGSDGGARYNGVSEKTLNLTLANKLTSRLEAMGYEVRNVRTNDKTVNNLDRAKEANTSDGDIYVSLHHNAMGRANS
ncbi:MAG TPA: glucosaminidase domain-containing protein, partial [Atopostipes sp.]|nr:glucosaminidase domain-containing protein [Atopostipes sp.]